MSLCRFSTWRRFHGVRAPVTVSRTALLAAGVGGQVDQMLTYSAVGTPAQVSDYLDGFIRHTEADEVIVAHQAPTIEGRLRSVTLLAEAMQAVPA